jgi:hypothetical protein
MNSVDDGHIQGAITQTRQFCGNCMLSLRCIRISIITLPEGIEPSAKLIAYTTVDYDEDRGTRILQHQFLGIGCGCYAKFHRQIAHIQDKVKK